MPDGRLLHLRDTYPTETAWAPRYVGDELRQVRAAAWQARLPVFELTTQHASLEEAFMRLTDDSVDFRSYDAAEAVAAR